LAKVLLQKLLTHTIERVIELQRKVLTTVIETVQKSFLKCEFFFSYGFYGSTGHPSYKQKFVEPSASTSQQTDSSLFATALIPLIDVFGNILWNNRTQSIRFCRPLKLEFIKETEANILEEEKSIRKEIDDLEAFHVKVDQNKSVESTINYF